MNLDKGNKIFDIPLISNDVYEYDVYKLYF